MYKHSIVAPTFKINNRTRFYSLCKSALGADYKNWIKHQNYKEVEKLAHTVIYEHDPVTYKPKKGLELQVCYLIQADANLGRRSDRKQCYEQAVASAIDAGVVTADTVLTWR